MLHQLRHYIVHRLKSFHLHGIHSPFVFEFQRNCLQDRSNYAGYESLVRFRESVFSNPQQLKIEDHGAGSKRLQVASRSTTNILKHNCSTEKRTQLLHRIAIYLDAERTLELGTSLGVGTNAMATASKQVVSVEGSTAVAQYARERLHENGILNVEVVSGTFRRFFNGELSSTPSGTYDLIFMDGHHDGPATLDYFERLLPYCTSQTVVVIDDIYWSKGMTNAWRQLTRHLKVTASIDTFQWGILFFRKEQGQQAFYINV